MRSDIGGDMNKEKESIITLDPIKKCKVKIALVGDSDLILNKKARSFEELEIFKQSHPKGTKIPKELQQPYNLFEKLITSITWENKIPVYDDYSMYTKEMWEELIYSNRPCILSKAFKDSFMEAFISLGYKEATSRNGTDFKRSVNISNWKNPVDITSATFSQHLTPNTGITKTNVIAQYNVFSGWKCEIEISHIDYIFATDTVLEIINNAGEFIGIGTRRAEGFGRYHVESIN